MSIHSLVKPALLASALAAFAAAPAAFAQDTYGDNESVIVHAPQFHVERDRFGALQRVSLSRAVPYDDLDLRNASGARELRLRVVETARDICDQLAEAYPGQEEYGMSCYRDARSLALIRADRAIRDARYSD